MVVMDDEEEDASLNVALPVGTKNYMTPAGYARLKAELLQLLDRERPDVVKVVQWAAGNGDRSENADYQYGKRRLREIDRRIRFLTRRLDLSEVIDPAKQQDVSRVYFGARVSICYTTGCERTIRIVGVDEIDLSVGDVSWVSPIARALFKQHCGDQITFRTPQGIEIFEITAIDYS